MLKYEMDEKVVRQQVTNRGKREKKRKFSPQSLTIKIIKSSKVTKKERKKEGLTSSRFEYDTAKSRERKRKGREREKEREEKCFPL